MSYRFSLARVLRQDDLSSRTDIVPGLPWGWDIGLEPAQKYRWFLGRNVERIERLGLTITIQHDFNAFAEVTRSMEGYDEFVSPAFDPRYNDLHPGRAFWLRVDAVDGPFVACIAGKVFHMASLHPHIADLSIWYDNDPTLPHRDETIEMIADRARAIRGTVSMTGRLWTHPAWRNRGLSSYLPLLARTMLLAKHRVDFHFGLVNVELVRKNVPILRYGFPRAEPCVRVKPMGDARSLELWMVWMSREELIADVDDAVSDN